MNDFDVIIVGFGVAGACAAIEAHDRGAKVLILDRAIGGGATALSGGVMYAGGGTRFQREAGYEDTPENMFAYLRQEVRGAVSDRTLRQFCEESVANLCWLEALGARYNARLCTYKTSYPNDPDFLYFSGNEKAWPYKLGANPAPRGHRHVAKGLESGAAFFEVLRKAVKKRGIEFRPLSRVSDLIMDEECVVGVKYRTAPLTPKLEQLVHRAGSFMTRAPVLAKWYTRRAEKLWEASAISCEHRAATVILCTGGFIHNRAMVAEYAPVYLKAMPLGTAGDDGSGIRLGQTAGGKVAFMDRATAWRFLNPPSSFTAGIAVGQDGTRIANEDLYGATFSEVLIHKYGGRGYLIVNHELWKEGKQLIKTQGQSFHKWIMLYLTLGGHRKARTLEALALKIGVPINTLRQSLDYYNEGIAQGYGDPFHKNPDYCRTMLSGPYYAIDISVENSAFYPVPVLTLGGLAVDEETGAVQSVMGKSIPGLYAAGRTAAGICANGYISGLSLADGVFSGRRVGRAVTAILNK
ncbi:hypothetical protein BJD20_09320 [Acinetobacter proteolyticus]|uniref:FAD-binding protein n=1 Tax=Acinetobacter proteolyticus TaxID=1776741 RepID=UPI0008634490|nr:FAD-binding protein [Acinetobacter proteolyticus]OEY92096.1 hypothetical protein BJD20_09320 [Acinetobacter proteolyticus]